MRRFVVVKAIELDSLILSVFQDYGKIEQSAGGEHKVIKICT